MADGPAAVIGARVASVKSLQTDDEISITLKIPRSFEAQAAALMIFTGTYFERIEFHEPRKMEQA
jgi:hypothetical protein